MTAPGTRVLIVAIACAWTVGGSVACTKRGLKPDSMRLRHANVLLVTIDTLRRDRLGAYGNTGRLTATLDELAASGLRYDAAYSHVPMTLPAHTSILTGRTPPHHGVRNNVTFRLDRSVPTIATVLKADGYRTAAFVGAFVLDARFGLNRGFDVYDDRSLHETGSTSFAFAQRRAADVVHAAESWILEIASARPEPNPQRPAPNAQSPYFAWVHLFDPHAPYDAPKEFRPGRTPYDAEVAYTDAMLGQFLAHLRSAGALDHTLVIVTADHGESLGEHGERTHGLFAYNSTLAVPLIIAGPGVPAGVVDAPVAHVDLLPTIADLVGIAMPHGLDGQSLAQPLNRERAIYFEALDANLTRGWAPLTGIVQGGWKYIHLPLQELYDLGHDPLEVTNLGARESGRLNILGRQLQDVAGTERRAVNSVVDSEAAARLRSLGYVGGDAAAAGRSGLKRVEYTAHDDPKELVQVNEQFNAALEAFNEGRRADALNTFTAVLHRRPDFVTARTSAATVLLASGRPADALALLRDAPPEERDSPELLAKMGAALRDAGDLAGAAAAFERAQRAGDENPDLFNDLGVVFARMGRVDDARRMFRTLLDRDPDSAGTWYNLGMLELSTNHPEAAATALRRAVAAQPDYGDAWQALGAALLNSDRAAAVDAWQRAERLRPSDYDLLFNLGMVLADGPNPGEALPYLERFAREAPRDRYARDLPQVNARIARIRRAG